MDLDFMEKKIDLMIVGAQKAGTTSLLRYLSEHPQCVGHPQKELGYFTDDTEYNEGINKVFKKYYANKDKSKHLKVIGKNAGLFTNQKGLKRLYDINPHCELVVILRNPVERTYSSYLMEKNFSGVKFKFDELPELIEKQTQNKELWDYHFFIEFSMYARHLKELYRFFPKEQITIILYSELKEKPLEVCTSIFNKLGIDPTFKPNTSIRYNETNKTRSNTYGLMVMKILKNDNPIKQFLKLFIPEKNTYKYGEMLRNLNKKDEKHESINPLVKQYLLNYFRPHNNELEKMIGKDLSDWNK